MYGIYKLKSTTSSNPNQFPLFSRMLLTSTWLRWVPGQEKSFVQWKGQVSPPPTVHSCQHTSFSYAAQVQVLAQQPPSFLSTSTADMLVISCAEGLGKKKKKKEQVALFVPGVAIHHSLKKSLSVGNTKHVLLVLEQRVFPVVPRNSSPRLYYVRDCMQKNKNTHK